MSSAADTVQQIAAEASADQIRNFIQQRRMRVLTSQGYAGAGYDDPVALLAARRAGKPVTFYPADQNHARALAQAASKHLPAPTDFRGAAHAAMLPPAPGR